VVPGRLLFLGSLDWMPNIDGLKWFVSEVYPLVRRQRPDVSLQIVGRRPDPIIRQLPASDPSISVLADVADVRPALSTCELFVVPLRVGGGSRLKIFEAMAMAQPVVSTTIGAEGLPVRDQHDIALGDTAVEFSTQVLGLLGDPQRRQQQAQTGFRLVTENYSWRRIAQEFYERCQQLIPKSA
jgi:glycosyltransferase involved in cell wall biosynthesis